MKPQAFIFDMDGVLIDSQPLHYQVDMAVLDRCGVAAEMDMVTPFTGMSAPDRWPAYKARHGLAPSVDALIQLQNGILMETFRREPLSAITGIPALLAALTDEKQPLAVASSSSHALIALILEKIGVAAYFSVVVSGEDVAAGKPAPDVFLYAAEKLNTPPAACVVVEDSPNGIRAAKNAGMVCVAYKNPTTVGDGFALADYVIERYADFPALTRDF